MRAFIIALSVALSASCVGTEIGNPPTPSDAQVNVDVVGVDDSPAMNAMPVALTLDDGIEVERAVMLIGDLRFRQVETCDEAGADFTDGFVAELLEGTVDVDQLEMPSGAYCRVDARPRRGGDDGFAEDFPELLGLTAYAEGTYQGTPFVARTETDDEMSFRGDFELVPGEQRMLMEVDVPAWFDSIDFDAAELEDGRIEIGHEGGDFGDQFKQNFLGSVSVTIDVDGELTELIGED